MSDPLLKVEGLAVEFRTEHGLVRAVEGVSFHIDRSETLGLVGESGCGKSVTAMSLVRLIPDPPGRIASGKIWFDGLALHDLPIEKFWDLRGQDIGMVFQEPMSSLDPLQRIGKQLVEVVELHTDKSPEEAREMALKMLNRVGIPDAERCLKQLPHELSGGMQQRVMIAMALMLKPKLLIADEPTTALDVTIQAQILDLLKELQKEMGLSVLMITHDLSVVARVAHRVAVMYAGHIVESAPAAEIFRRPVHPYTEGLWASIPILRKPKERLYSIPGSVPSPTAYPRGCRFAPRCPLVEPRCRQDEPPLAESKAPEHKAACWVRSPPA